MGMLDNIQDKGKDIMNDPTHRAKIEQLAKDKNMSIEDAKTHYMKHTDTN